MLKFLKYSRALFTWTSFYKYCKWKIRTNLFMTFWKIVLQTFIYLQKLTCLKQNFKPGQNTQNGNHRDNLWVRTQVSILPSQSVFLNTSHLLSKSSTWLCRIVDKPYTHSLSLWLRGAMNTTQQRLDWLN